MRISELSERSGVPVATVKYYLREGLLAPGEMLNARQSDYNDGHLARLHLIRGLVHVLGASVSQVREVLTILDDTDDAPLEAMGKATAALPTISESKTTDSQSHQTRAIRLLDHLGYRYDPGSPTVQQLNSALELADSIGISVDDDQATIYGEVARRIAEADFTRIPWDDPDHATAFAVLGTVVYEPVLLALRRLAHYEHGMDMEADHPAHDVRTGENDEAPEA